MILLDQPATGIGVTTRNASSKHVTGQVVSNTPTFSQRLIQAEAWTQYRRTQKQLSPLKTITTQRFNTLDSLQALSLFNNRLTTTDADDDDNEEKEILLNQSAEDILIIDSENQLIDTIV